MSGWRAGLAVLLGLLAGATVAAPAASAEPELSVSGLRQEPGLAAFFLSARDLPAGERLDETSVAVTAGGRSLALRDAVELARPDARSARRLTVLVLDTSGSMQGEAIGAARDAAAGYLSRLPSDVEVAVVTAGSPARTLLAPTADRAEAAAVLGGLSAAGETALYDGLVRAAGLAEDTQRYVDRRVVVLSDGADTASAASLASAQQRLGAVRATVDTVAFRTEEATSEVLAGLAEGSGGRSYQADDPAALAGAFRRAAGAFTVQLLVTVVVPADLAGNQTRLEVSAVAGGQTIRTSVPVTLAVDPNAAGVLPRVTGGGPSTLWTYGLPALVFVGLLAIGLIVFAPLLDSGVRRRTPESVFSTPQSMPSTAPGDANGPVAMAALALTKRMVSGGLEERIATQLSRAGMRLRPHEWLLLRGLACLTTGILIGLFAGPIVGFLGGLLVGWAVTELYQRLRAERRSEAFLAQLPDALQLVIGSLRSGFSLSQSIDAMVRELPDPISTEFGRALGETRLGVDLADALDRVAARMVSTDLAWAVVAVRVQREVGGNLAEVLSTTVETMRSREALRRQVRALSAEGRLSAWILLALPIVAALFMLTFRGEYLRPLYTEPIGLLMSVVGIGLVAVGAFWLSRVVKVEI